jgi:hypothetical protein
MAKLPNLVIDLFDQYGSCHPRPSGDVLTFQVIHENTTFPKAKAEIEALLTVHGITANSLSIAPGLEVNKKVNRSVKFSVAKNLLM